MSGMFLSRIVKNQGKLQTIAGVVVLSALAVVVYLSFQAASPEAKTRDVLPAETRESNSLPGPTSGPEKLKVNAALPTLEAVAANPALAKELGLTITNCRAVRIADSLADRPPGLDPFIALGTETNCRELFDRYGDRLDQALYHLKSSRDPVERGQYYDANYDVLASNFMPFTITTAGAPARKAFEKLADEHFEDIARDLDHCSADSVARMHLSQKMTSAKYMNPAVEYFTSRVLVAHNPDETKLLAYSNSVASERGLDPVLLARINASVQRATSAGCGIGTLGQELAVWKGYGGDALPEDPKDDLDTSDVK